MALACGIAGVRPAAADDTTILKRLTAAASGTGFAGTIAYDRGLFTYQDYVFDDYGADTRQRAPQTGTAGIGVTSGKFRYPTDTARYGDNAADIDQVRIAADGSRVHIAVALNTLLARDSTVVGLAVDTGRSGGLGAWPFDAGLSSSNADTFVTFWGTGGAVTTRAGTRPLPAGRVLADTRANVLTAAVDTRDLPGDRWRIQLATGIWDRDARSWMAVPPTAPDAARPGYGSPTVAARAFNVAFRTAETGSFREQAQAAALAAGDISAFSAAVDVKMLRAGRSLASKLRAGFYEGVLTSSFTIPRPDGGPSEGMTYAGAPARGTDRTLFPSSFHYLGRRQPFGLYVPRAVASGSRTRRPLVIALHGRGATFSSHNAEPGFERDVGEGLEPTIIVAPFGRGPLNFYADYGEKDVFEVFAAVVARFPVDLDRVYLTGYSMGGYGTFRLATLYPDRFAAAVSWAATAGEYLGMRSLGRHLAPAAEPTRAATFGSDAADAPAEGNAVDLLENLRSVPVLQIGGSNDEIQPISGQLAATWRLDELGYRHAFRLYPGLEHLSFALIDEWSDARTWIGKRRRATVPATVIYKTSPAWGNAKLGLRHDRAYWVSNIRVHGPQEMSNYGTVAARSHMRCDPASVTSPVLEPVAGPPPYIEFGTDWLETSPRCTRANRLSITLSNVDALTIGPGSGLDPARPLVITSSSDRPARITLSATGKSVDISKGTHTITIEGA